MEKTRKIRPFFVLTVIAFLAAFQALLPVKLATPSQDNAFEVDLWVELRAVQTSDVDSSGPEGGEIAAFSQTQELSAQPQKPGAFIRPRAYRVYALNKGVLQNVLAIAPMQFTMDARTEEVVMTLPMPDGTYARIRIEESPIISPELQDKYPQLKTYRAQGIDDPTATVRFDITPAGFHAQLVSEKGTAFVDPLDGAEEGYYMSYWKHDLPERDPFQCLTEEELSTQELMGAFRSPNNPSGDQMFTYRMIVTATGEYTDYFEGIRCPTPVPAGCGVNEARNQIITTMNRVSGIYERDVAITFNIVGFNIYDDPTTDPYNGTGVNGTLLSDHQTDLDNNWSGVTYDIGHILTRLGSGSSGLVTGDACGSTRARGGTGSSVPFTDPFDVDYAAHEIGHQLDASHTWNGNAGSCASAGQWQSDSAYEPGSGSTIMAYAGTCTAAQNVQANSDDYFHTHSFDQITAFRGTCGTSAVTGNTVPTVNAGSDYTIPRDTPFTLTATGNDTDGDTLTYCWEQFDLGTSATRGAPQSTYTTGPLFRSRTPTTDPSRTFPRLADILSGAATPWEVLPTVDRDLNFRVTVRDNRAGGGGVDWDDMLVTVAGNPFFITSPSAGDNLECGMDTTIAWNVGGGSVASNVRALISDDGGISFSELISSTLNDGNESTAVPQMLTSMGRIKLEAVGNIFFDISDQFSIRDTLAPLLTAPGDLLNVECTSPQGATPSLGDANATDQCDSNPTIINDAPGTGVFPIGTTPVTWTAYDNTGNTSTDIQQVTVVDTTPPEITAPTDVVAECTSPEGTPVDIGMAMASDVCDDSVSIQEDSPDHFNLGNTIVTWTATDNSGNVSTDTQDVTIEDTTPPEFELSVTPDVLWPPNHELSTVQALITVSDVCDDSPTVRLVSITSNEPDNGLGDGDTVNDIQGADFGTDDREFQVRAERGGLGDGRIYTITYEVEDDSGNVTVREATVRVPKSKKI